jgi:hypothetical protein
VQHISNYPASSLFLCLTSFFFWYGHKPMWWPWHSLSPSVKLSLSLSTCEKLENWSIHFLETRYQRIFQRTVKPFKFLLRSGNYSFQCNSTYHTQHIYFPISIFNNHHHHPITSKTWIIHVFWLFMHLLLFVIKNNCKYIVLTKQKLSIHVPTNNLSSLYLL